MSKRGQKLKKHCAHGSEESMGTISNFLQWWFWSVFMTANGGEVINSLAECVHRLVCPTLLASLGRSVVTFAGLTTVKSFWKILVPAWYLSFFRYRGRRIAAASWTFCGMPFQAYHSTLYEIAGLSLRIRAQSLLTDGIAWLQFRPALLRWSTTLLTGRSFFARKDIDAAFL